MGTDQGNVTFNSFSKEPEIDHPCNSLNTYDRRIVTLMVVVGTVVIGSGLVCNFANSFVFLQKEMRRSMVNCILLARSTTDLLVLTTGFFLVAFPQVAGYFGRVKLIESAWHWIAWVYPIGAIAQTETVWLTVLLSVHRCIAVCLPLTAKQLCTTGIVKVSIIIITLWSIGFNAVRFLEVEHTDCCCLRANKDYLLYYMFWGHTVTTFVVPFVILIISSSLTVYKVRQSCSRKVTVKVGRGRSKYVRRQSNSSMLRFVQPKENRTTVMLVTVVLIFLICSSFSFLINILERVMLHSSWAFRHLNKVYRFVVSVSNICALLHSTLNTLVYYQFCESFRNNFNAKFCCKKRQLVIAESSPKSSASVAIRPRHGSCAELSTNTIRSRGCQL